MRLVPALLALSLLPATPALAVEGMFLLDKLPVARLEASGLKVGPAALAKLSRAVVQVAGGGTGSFVSPRGLVVTNHHVAYRCIAMLGARKEHLGLLERGHLARSAAEELPCPGYDLLIVEEVRDVKQQVLAAAKPKVNSVFPQRRPRREDPNWAARFEALRLKQEDLVAACEKDGAHVCEVSALDGGASYTLSVYRRIRDVRLVYAPPNALGKFGGDVDNWMFPRHTADFAFLRAYVSAAGKGEPYAKGNAPLATPNHLALARGGVRAGSLVTVIGFPARTSRHASSHAVRFYKEQNLPATIALLRGLIDLLGAEMKRSADVRRKYASLEAGLQNAAKYYEMSKAGFERWRTLERKLEAERALAERLAGDAAASARMKQTLGEIERVYRRYRAIFPRQLALGRMVGICPSLRAAYDLAKWGVEKGKPSRMRKEERYKDKNVYRIKDAAERLDREVNLEADKALLVHFLREAQKLPAAQRSRSVAALLRWAAGEQRRRRALGARLGRWLKHPQLFHLGAYLRAALPDDPLAAAAELLYGPAKPPPASMPAATAAPPRALVETARRIEVTQLLARGDDPRELERAVALRRRLFEMSGAELKRFKDPLLAFARDLERELTAIKEGPAKEVEQHLGAVLHPRWVEEVLRPSYPDANFTVRLSFGSVKDYTSAETGKKHRHMTTLAELVAKDKGAYPFLVPPSLKRSLADRVRSPFFDAQLKDIPVNFTATLDTTGGNSGSPVLDDRGRLVGLLFDGTPESILSDWQFLKDRQRSICLDIRFALYLAALDRNQRLLKELGAATK